MKTSEVLTHYNMNEPCKCHAKCKKPDTKSRIPYDPIYMKWPDQAHLKRQKTDWWWPRDGRGDTGESAHRYGILFGVFEMFWN